MPEPSDQRLLTSVHDAASAAVEASKLKLLRDGVKLLKDIRLLVVLLLATLAVQLVNLALLTALRFFATR